MDEESQNLRIQIASLKSKIKYLTPMSILIENEGHLKIPDGYIQPPNGTLYEGVHNTAIDIYLPPSENFKYEGFTITIFNNTNALTLHTQSEGSTDVITFQGDSTRAKFTLGNRGQVTLMWTSGGWIVLSSYGFNVDDT